MRILAYEDCQRCKESVVNVATHAFEVSMCDPELMKVRYAKRRFGKLRVVEAHKYITGSVLWDSPNSGGWSVDWT